MATDTVTLCWLDATSQRPDAAAGEAARHRQSQLTKPAGSLGELETLAVRLAALQGRTQPRMEQVSMTVFAADHGVARHAVSAFPQAVTGEMLRNFSRGGAAINVLAGELAAELEVIDLGVVNDPGELPGVQSARLGAGTADWTQEPALTPAQCQNALNIGRASADRAVQRGAQLYIGGEMGIGNTTTAAALACAVLNRPAADLAGPGTGVSASGVRHKCTIIEAGLQRHRALLDDPLQVLRGLGGFEIAALAGAYGRCAALGLPVLIDGFISSVAALIACRLQPAVSDWLLFSHRSAEPGHGVILDALDARPLLNLGLRLGEGSGAAVAVPLLRLACALHNGMATFAEAGVSDSEQG